VTSRSASPGPGRDSDARRARVANRAKARAASSDSLTETGAGSDAAPGSAKTAGQRRPALTGRAFVVLISLGVVVVTLALPVREWFAQRAQLAALQDENSARMSRVTDLQHELVRLKDRAYVTALVRDRLHYVLPGEVGYVVLDPQSAPSSATVQSALAAQGPSAPWYSTLWGSVQAADGTTPAVQPNQVRPDAPR